MSVSLSPSNSLGFKRPLTQLVKRSLTITNHNSLPVAFKVKTTAPKLYCVRPNSGRVEPGESVDVLVMLQALKEEPPLNAKCKDKFLIQSTIITPEKESLGLADIWAASPEGGEELKVHQHKLRVTYLPAEGQMLEEEDEAQLPQPNISAFAGRALDPLPYSTARHHQAPNGHPEDAIPNFNEAPPLPVHEPFRVGTPAGEFSVAREDSHDEPSHDYPTIVPVALPRRSPSPAPSAHLEHIYAPAPIPIPPRNLTPGPAPVPVPVTETPQFAELAARYNQAQAEIDRLRAALTAASTLAPSEMTSELRRRPRALSDVGSETETDVATMVDEPLHQEGVPLQVVAIIALGVFITTYLFF